MSNSLGLLNSNDKAKLDNIINIKFSNVLQELTPNKSYVIYDNKAYNKLIEIAHDENNVKYTTIILHISIFTRKFIFKIYSNIYIDYWKTSYLVRWSDNIK